MTRNRADAKNASALNGLVASAFTLAVVGIAGVLILAQYLAVA